MQGHIWKTTYYSIFLDNNNNEFFEYFFFQEENKENVHKAQINSSKLNANGKSALNDIETVNIEHHGCDNTPGPRITDRTSRANEVDDEHIGAEKFKLKTQNITSTNKNKTSRENSKQLDEDHDFDPYMVATQKLPDQINTSDFKHHEITDTEFLNPTQKLNLNITTESSEEETTLTEKISSQTDLFDFLESNIQTCIGVIKNISGDDIKKRLRLMFSCIKKLKKNYVPSGNPAKITTNVSVQTTFSVADASIQTVKFDTCHIGAQTDIEFIDRGIQTTLTENSYSQNNSEAFIPDRKTNFVETITQGTKKALESFLSDPGLILNGSKDNRNNSSQVANVAAVTVPRKEVLSPSMDNFDFETQQFARKLLEGGKSTQRSMVEAQTSKMKTQEFVAKENEKLSLQASKV